MDVALVPGSNNLAISNHKVRMTESLSEEVAQKLFIKFRFFLGEYYLDTSVGIDFFGQILVKNPNIRLIQSIFRAKLAETPGVGEVKNLKILYNKITRELGVSWIVVLEDGTELEGEA